MSVRFRLNALIVALSSLGVALLVAAMVIGAGPRIHAENDSTMRLAREFVETTVASLQGTSDAGARLQVLLDGLKELRHVHIYRIDDPAPHALPDEPLAGNTPSWLARLGAPPPPIKIPVVVNGEDFGELVIAPRVSDEAEEIWNSIVSFTLGAIALAIAAVLFTSLLIAHLLKPIKELATR